MIRSRPLSVGLRAALLALLIGWAVAPASAIVIRHDRDDARYVDLGSRFPAAVSILPDGTGVLVAPDWVLTAAHVARGIAGRSPSIEVAGREIAVVRVLLHPEWQEMGPHDIALLKLAEPVEGIPAAVPYPHDDERGQIVTFAGRGDFGTGLTGPRTADRKKRAATNRVEETDDDWLFFTFDEGEAATDLEGVSGPGDSGGPALVTRDGQLYTLGVSVFADGQGKGPGRYGVREGYTRVSRHREWIVGVMAGQAIAKEIRVAPVERMAPRDKAGRPVAVAMSPGDEAELPETAAGRLVARLVETYNGGDADRLTRFVEEHAAAQYLAEHPADERRDLYRRLFTEHLGRITLKQVLDVGDTALTVLFEAARGGMAELRFELEPGDPPKLAGLRVAKVQIDAR